MRQTAPAAPRWILLAPAVLAALALLLCGCGQGRVQEHRFDIAPTTGLLAVDIENFHGSVEVRVSPKHEPAVVVGKVWASERLATRHEDALDTVTVRADLVEEGARAVLRVRSSTARENTGDHRADLTILVPRCDGVRIENRGGTVLVVGAGGAAEIANHSGPVEFRTARPVTDPVTITTVDGNIYYQIPKESSGAFDLETLDGAVFYRDRVASSANAYTAPRVGQASLNDGPNPVVMRTNRGDIFVLVDADPVSITRVFKATPPDPRDLFFQNGSRRFTRNLPEDHPDLERRTRANAYQQGY